VGPGITLTKRAHFFVGSGGRARSGPRPPGPGIKAQLIRLEILTLGRQSQTCVRFPEIEWKGRALGTRS